MHKIFTFWLALLFILHFQDSAGSEVESTLTTPLQQILEKMKLSNCKDDPYAPIRSLLENYKPTLGKGWKATSSDLGQAAEILLARSLEIANGSNDGEKIDWILNASNSLSDEAGAMALTRLQLIIVAQGQRITFEKWAPTRASGDHIIFEGTLGLPGTHKSTFEVLCSKAQGSCETISFDINNSDLFEPFCNPNLNKSKLR